MNLTEIIDYLKTNLDQTDITLWPGASDELIEEFEIAYGMWLPDDVRTFYEFSNGFESEADLFHIVPLEEIIERREEHGGTPCIAEFMIYGNFWELEVNAERHNVYSITCTIDKKIVLTNSFAGFLTRFLEGGIYGPGGLYHWHEEIENNNNPQQ